MSARNRKRSGPGTSPKGGDLRGEAERLIAKGRFKDAVKQAKLWHREAGTPESHRLLERAYLLRARQLRRDGMPAAAEEVARHLLDFGVTDEDLIGDLVPLLLALGLSAEAMALRDRLGSPEERAGVDLAAADQAVLRPDRIPAALAGLREGALRVRGALEALEAGDEARASELLRDVSRGSPFADWRLFVRGLAAFRRRDDARAAENWGRLDPARAAARIARRLRGLADDGGGADVAALERRAFGEPLLARLRDLGGHVAGGRWGEAIRLLGPLRDALRRVDPALAGRLTGTLIPRLVRSATEMPYAEAMALVRDFTRRAEPTAIDPRWNRLWALIWEGPQGELERAEEYWLAYLKDLESLPALDPGERDLARALVWEHLGRLYLAEAEAGADADWAGPFGPPPDPGQVERDRRRAVECLEEGIRLAPGHLETHEALIRAFEDWGHPERVEAAARRLLEAHPDHVETLVLLASHHFRRDEPAEALGYARRARALRPLDEGIAGLEWSTLVSLARRHALKKRWDEARAAFDEADRLRPDEAKDFHQLARKAALERKAGRADRAEERIREAEGQLPEPTPLWLALAIEAARYRLPKAEKDRFAGLWKDALKKKCRGDTAGAIAALLSAYLGVGIEYTGRAGHIRDAVGYLRRTSRTRYTPEDLARVCGFLVQLPREQALFEKMVQRGVRNFPESPLFLLMAGAHEVSRGPFRGHLGRARDQLSKALELAQASGDPQDAALVPKIKESLSRLSGLEAGPLGMMGLPFFGGPGGAGPSPDDLLDLFGFPDDEEDFGDEDEFSRPAPPRRRPGPPSKRRKPK